MTKSYGEKLKDPRWQKKRLEILERDGWECTNCGTKDVELHVHHLKYNGNPWDAKNEDLQTLCKDCHAIAKGSVEIINDITDMIMQFSLKELSIFQTLLDRICFYNNRYDVLIHLSDSLENIRIVHFAGFMGDLCKRVGVIEQGDE